jgi:hypothetical protein
MDGCGPTKLRSRKRPRDPTSHRTNDEIRLAPRQLR